MHKRVGLAAALLLVAVGLPGAFVYSGIYDVGADAPHSRPVYGLLEELREKSIARHSRGIAVPSDLDTAKRIQAGAGLYREMCAGCHNAPGVEPSELSQGLYPRAPELAKQTGLSPAEQFWIIKHGVKLSAMPAWGKTHDDELIWDMVAFLRQLPKMSPSQYEAAVANAPQDHDDMMEGRHDTASKPHSHAGGDTHTHSH